MLTTVRVLDTEGVTCFESTHETTATAELSAARIRYHGTLAYGACAPLQPAVVQVVRGESILSEFDF